MITNPSTSAHLKSGGLALPEKVRDRQDDVSYRILNKLTGHCPRQKIN